MADPRDNTLDLSSLRLRKEYPVARTQFERATPLPQSPPGPAKDEVAAQAARARISALPDYTPLPEFRAASHPDAIAPAAPTHRLVTDKERLAAEARTKPLVHGRKLPTALMPFLTAVGVFLIVLLLFKAPVIISQIQYTFGKPATPAAAIVPAGEIIPSANTMSIPKLNIHAPVLYEPSIQEAAIQKALENGVVHYGNTAVPGEKGNVAIFGHSSNDWWEPGNYKFVFVLLDKLVAGDQITVDYNSTRYVYEVTGSRIVDPTEVSVLNSTPTPTLTLITCTPPGTALKRLVVTAKQVSPDPSRAAVAANSSTGSSPSTLASSSPSFLEQLAQSWSNLFGGNEAKPSPSPEAPGQLPAIK